MRHTLSVVVDTWETRCACGVTFAAPGSVEKGEAHVAERAGSRGKREDRLADIGSETAFARTTAYIADRWGIGSNSAYSYLSGLRTRGLVNKGIKAGFPRRARWSLRAKPA